MALANKPYPAFGNTPCHMHGQVRPIVAFYRYARGVPDTCSYPLRCIERALNGLGTHCNAAVRREMFS